jgi:hypothetical protein
MKRSRILATAAMGLCFLAATWCGAQSKQWDRRFGGASGDEINAARQTSDGGYILVGETLSGLEGDKTEASRGGVDYWVVKVDANGAKQWDRRFGGAGNDTGNDVQQTLDGGYILGGYSDSGAGGDKTEASRDSFDYWIVKIDATGAKQWDRRFGGSLNDYGRAVQQTSDGGYILGGYSYSGADGDKTEASRGHRDYWIVKVAANGAKQWDRRFGGSQSDYLRAMQQTLDGGYILIGFSISGADGDKTEASRGGHDYWIVKVAANGAKQWDRRFGGSNDDCANAVQQTADGGYILGGYSNSGADGDKTEASRGWNDYWLVKMAANGAKQWDRRFGGSLNDYCISMQQALDGGYILGGYSNSGADGDKTEASRGGSDFWIVKVDPQGQKRWDRRFGGTASEMLYSLRQTADGGYILGGHSDSPVSGDKTEAARGGFDYWAVKIAVWPADAYEPDDSHGIAKTIASGQVQNHSFHEPRDQDWAKFTVTAPGALNARIETSGTVGDTILSVFNGLGGPLVGHNDDIGGANKFSRVTLPALLPGTYYIATTALGGNVVLPAYSLRASWTQNYEPDRYEADNGRSAAKRIRNGRTQNRSIHAAGNRDWAKFTVGAGGARNVLIETRGASGDTRIRLYNRRLRRLASNDDSGPGRFSRIRRSSLPAGTYYVRIQEKGDDGTIGAYTLKVRWTQR